MKVAFLTAVFLLYVNDKIEAKLKQLNVVFRHSGDRAPDDNGLEAYPNNPYKNYKFLPEGSGGLNNNGKLREYNLGTYLREQYNDFLGSEYISTVVYARSDFFERTRMSLQLVLAGLYPPDRVQLWDEYLHWQPTVTTYLPHLDDNLILAYECPKYLKAREQVELLPEVVERTESFELLMAYLTLVMGKNISSPIDMTYVFHGLMAVASENLTLPWWSEDIFPHGWLYKGSVFEYELASYSDDMKRLNGGMLLRKITDDMTDACNGNSHARKVNLYASHEFNVAAVLSSMNLYKPHVPRYSSAVIVELHEEDYKCKVKVRHYKGYTLDYGESIDEYLHVPGCETDYLGEFKRVLSNHIATDDDVTSCDKRSLRDALERGGLSVPEALTKPLLDGIHEEDKLRGVLL